MKKKLQDIADIRTGYQFRGKVSAAEDANVAVIQIKDVDKNLAIRTDDLMPVKVDKPEAYLVSHGDVLFLSRGNQHYAAVVNEPLKNTIATGFFFILSPRAAIIRPDFLAWTINQPEFQESLRPFVRGSHMPIVSKSDFQNITIRVPPPAVQDHVMNLQCLFKREKQLATTLQAKRDQLVQAVSHQLITGQPTAQGNQP